MGALSWVDDELAGYEKLTLRLDAEGDGELCATLVRKRMDVRPTRAVLYVHGYVDYFFQTHVADAYLARGIDFYALDLRRYGRSIRRGNHLAACKSLDDYFTDISWAVDTIVASRADLRSLIAHSTGGLIACLYLSRGPRRSEIPSAILNNPFLDFRVNALERAGLGPIAVLGTKFPQTPAPVKMNRVYGQTLHKSESGEWDYDLSKKPLDGFGVTCGFIHVVKHAQEEVHRGLGIEIPILLQHSASWHKPGKVPTPADFCEDIVLCSDDSVRFAPSIGSRVRREAIEGGIHDLVLSRADVRGKVIASQLDFLG